MGITIKFIYVHFTYCTNCRVLKGDRIKLNQAVLNSVLNLYWGKYLGNAFQKCSLGFKGFEKTGNFNFLTEFLSGKMYQKF